MEDSKGPKYIDGKRVKPPTRKQILYAKHLPTSLTKREAALKAGYSESAASQPHIAIESRPSFKIMMDRVISSEKLIEKLMDGLDASKAIYDKEGNKVVSEPDYMIRHKYLDTAHKLRGDYAASKTEITTSNHSSLLDSLESGEIIDI